MTKAHAFKPVLSVLIERKKNLKTVCDCDFFLFFAQNPESEKKKKKIKLYAYVVRRLNKTITI